MLHSLSVIKKKKKNRNQSVDISFIISLGRTFLKKKNPKIREFLKQSKKANTNVISNIQN